MTMKADFVFPPKLSFSSLVSLESRYGMCNGRLLGGFVNAEIQFPRADSERLIEVNSRMRLSEISPIWLLCFSDSLPVK